MVITCPACEARYRLNRDKIQGRGAKITCPKCAHVFVVFNETEGAAPSDSREADAPSRAQGGGSSHLNPDTTTGAFKAILGVGDEKVVPTTTGKIRVVAPGKRGSRRTLATVESGTYNTPEVPDISGTHEVAIEEQPESEPDVRASDLNFREVGIKTWKVKVAIGLIYDFSDISTLKKYLGDKKVTPDDLISHNNKEWTRIGDIPNLDGHFVEVWKATKHAIATGESPAIKPKPKPKADETAKVDSTMSGAFSAAEREVSSTGTVSTIPGAYGANKARRNRKKKAQEEEKEPPLALIALAALVLIGGFAVYKMQPGDSPVTTAVAPIDVDDVGKVGAAELDAIQQKIAEQLRKKQEEARAGQVGEELNDIGEEATKDDSITARRARGELKAVQGTTLVGRQPLPTPKYQKPEPIKRRTPPPSQVESTGQVVTKKTSDPGQMYLTMARKKLASSDFGAAKKAARTATQKSPSCIPCWKTLGEALKAQGKQQEASEAFAKADSVASSSSRAGQ